MILHTYLHTLQQTGNRNTYRKLREYSRNILTLKLNVNTTQALHRLRVQLYRLSPVHTG